MNIMKTYSARPSHVESQWHVFDATDKVLGRLATEVSILLQGKHKPMYTRHILTGDFVIVVNASKIKVTGNKMDQKFYRRHSNYPGGLHEAPMSKVHADHPDRIIRAAVQGMLPKNILGRQMLSRLKIYAGETHPHGAQIKDLATAEVVVRPKEREIPVPQEAPEVQQPIVEALLEEPAQENAPEVEQPVAEVAVEEPTQDDAPEAEQPVAEVAVEEPTQDNVPEAEQPVAQLEEQPEEEPTENPTEDEDKIES